MKANITVLVSSEGKLEIPPEIEAQLNPGDRYSVIVTADRIVFQKVAGFDWEELRRRRESLPNYPSRREFMKLPLEDRRNILAKQAEVMLQHYQQDREWQELEAGDLIDY